MSIFKPYIDFGRSFSLYWKAYGGLSAVVTSPYVHLSIVITAISRAWMSDLAWVDDCIAVVPSILGFSLGAFAIFLAFSDGGFLKIMTSRLGEATEQNSLYMQISGMFAHFMLAQTVAITLALIGRSFGVSEPACNCMVLIFSGIGYAAFIYSLLTVVASAFTLLRFASLYQKYQRLPRPSDNNDTSP
jgi:hypothetical protein